MKVNFDLNTINYYYNFNCKIEKLINNKYIVLN